MTPARIAAAIRKAKPDAALIAGDISYELEPSKFRETYAPLMTTGTPVFAVLGNHDLGLPGDDVGAPLSRALSSLGLEMMDDRALRLNLPGGAIELVGLSDLWGKKQKMALVRAPSRLPRIVLTHNPSTAYKFSKKTDVDLLLAGHTHGGQIFIPFVTCEFTFACRIVRQGLAEFRGVPVFVTSGTGMTGLPMRFLVPPRIDVLNISYNACTED
jgi:predicted MPP superfamily phosphohydrolase